MLKMSAMAKFSSYAHLTMFRFKILTVKIGFKLIFSKKSIHSKLCYLVKPYAYPIPYILILYLAKVF